MKLIIALGGAVHANERFDQMIANPATLETFARNTVRKIREWNMDGIDVDWEFPENKEEHVIFLRVSLKILAAPVGTRCTYLECKVYCYGSSIQLGL